MASRAWRWTRRILLGLVAFVIVTVAGVTIFAHTDFGRGVIRQQVEGRMNAAFTGGASIGKLEGSPFGTLVVHDVVINGPDRKPMLAIKRLSFELELLPLVSSEARISGLVVEDVEVDLRRDQAGQLMIERLLKPAPKSRWSIDLADLAVRRARIAYDSGTEVMHLDDLDLTGAAQLPYAKPVVASMELHGSWRERAVPVAVEIAVRMDPELMTIPRLAARVGEVHVDGTDLRIVTSNSPMFGGSLVVRAPRAGVAQLVPELDLPGDLELELEATPVPQDDSTHFELAGTLAGEPVRALFHANLSKRSAAGVISAPALDVTKLSRGKLVVRGGGFVVFDVMQGAPGKLPIGHAMIHAAGVYRDLPELGVTMSLASDGERVSTRIGATNPGLTASLEGELRKLGDAITLERASIVASSLDPRRATGGRAPVRGVLRVDLTASGRLSPDPSLAVAGRIEGTQLRLSDVRVGSLKLAIDARRIPARPVGSAVLEVADVQYGDLVLRALKITAADRADGKIQVSMRSTPGKQRPGKQHPWLFEADAVVTPGKIVTVELQRHHVYGGNGADWTGTTGRVTFARTRIELRELKSTSRDGSLALAGVFHHAGRHAGDLTAKLDVTALSLDHVRAGSAGTLDAHVDIERRDGRLGGTALVTGRGLTLRPEIPTIDVDAKVRATAGRFGVDASAASPVLGTARLALDVAAPADVTDLRAWKRLGRDAIRDGRLALEGLELGKVAELAGIEGYGGRIDGDLRLSPTTIGGLVKVRDLKAPALRGAGRITADLHVTQSAPDELTSTLTARVDGLGELEARARLGMPDHLFDPAAWQQLGRGAFRGGSLRTATIELDPAQLDRFGITTHARGRMTVVAEVSSAAAGAKLTVALRTLRGSPIAQPIEADLLATIDDKGTTTNLVVKTRAHRRQGKQEVPVGPEVRLLEVVGSIPLTIRELANPRAALARPLQLTAKLANVPAKHLLAVFGRSEVTGGEIDGTIEIGGTLGSPTALAKLVATNLQVPPGRRPVKPVKRLVVEASWDGRGGKLVVDGTQDGGMLRITAQGSPEALADATVTLKATRFELASLLAFVPGPAGGATGQLDADLTLRGLEPRTARLAGELHLERARIPIAPAVGTLRRAKLDVVVDGRQAKVKLEGRLGGGSVKAAGTVMLAGAAPTAGDLTIMLRKVSPIGVVEPDIDADVTMKVRNENDRWIADVIVRNGNVVVPDERREPLKPPGAPADMVFITGDRIPARPLKRVLPSYPIIVGHITLEPMQLRSDEVRGVVSGKVTVTADGESIGLVGSIDADRGDLELFGRRYQVDRASIRFDGSLDPIIDMKITHDFPDVTTITHVRGRLSKPELIMSSNPGTYSQGQLLGFLLGGEPHGEAGEVADRATATGASLVANKLTGYLEKALPIDLDVLRYEHSTATTSAALTLGSWITRNLFIAYRQHLDARFDENSGEGAIEYWLSRRLVVEGKVGDRGYNGVDLLWRKRY